MERGDRVVVAIVTFLTVLLCSTAWLTLRDAKWFENESRVEYVQIPSPVPRPYPSPSPVIEYVEIPSAPVTTTVTQTVAVEVPARDGTGAACEGAIRAADELARAVESGVGIEASLFNYRSYRSVCNP